MAGTCQEYRFSFLPVATRNRSIDTKGNQNHGKGWLKLLADFIPVDLRFFSILYFQYIQICEGTLTLWRHSNMSYVVQWYRFWYQLIEEVHTYTLVANIGVSSVPYVLQKQNNLRRTRVKPSFPITANVDFRKSRLTVKTLVYMCLASARN